MSEAVKMNNFEVGFVVNTQISNNVGRRAKKLVETLSDISPNLDIHWVSLFEEKMSSKLVDMIKLLFSRLKVIHIIEPFGPSFLFLIPFRIFGKRIIYQTGDVHYKNAELSGQLGPKFLLFKLSERCHYFFSNKILVGSVGHESFLYSELDFSREHVAKVNYFGCPDIPSEWSNNADKDSQEDQLILDLEHKIAGKFVILYSSSLRVLKIGKDYVPRGWEIPFIVNHLVSEWHDDVVGIILGDGPGKRLIERISENLGVKDQILTPGNVSREHYFDVLSFGSIFFVESLDHVTYSIMYPSKISDYTYVGKPFIWSFNPESISWDDYPLLVRPARYVEKFFDGNQKYVFEAALLIHRFINNNSFKTKCFEKFNTIRNEFKDWDEIAKDVLVIYEKFKPTNYIKDSEWR